jgi:hypothetical protein
MWKVVLIKQLITQVKGFHQHEKENSCFDKLNASCVSVYMEM